MEPTQGNKPPKKRKHPPRVKISRQTFQNVTCIYCLRKYKNKNSINKHISTHKPCNEKHEEKKSRQPGCRACKEEQDVIDNYNLKCKYCNLGVKNPKQKENHVRRYHRGDK